jgi:hypothetical protein
MHTHTHTYIHTHTHTYIGSWFENTATSRKKLRGRMGPTTGWYATVTHTCWRPDDPKKCKTEFWWVEMEKSFPLNTYKNGILQNSYNMRGDAIWDYARRGQGPERRLDLWACDKFDFQKWTGMTNRTAKRYGRFPYAYTPGRKIKHSNTQTLTHSHTYILAYLHTYLYTY